MSTVQASLHGQPFTRTFQLDESSAIDTFIESLVPTANYGTNAAVAAGESNVEARTNRTLITPPLNLLSNVLSFTNVYLDLTISVDRSSNARDVKLYRILRDWVESQATWNIWSTGNNWTTAGAGGAGTDFDNTPIASLNLSATETGVKRWSLSTSVLLDMYKGVLPNYGFILRVDHTVTELNDSYSYHSSSATTSTNRPKWTFETIEAVP